MTQPLPNPPNPLNPLNPSSSQPTVPPVVPLADLPADPRPMFFAAARQALRVVETVRPEELDGPTPCTDFDVRTLTGHLLTVFRRITTVAAGGEARSVPQVVRDVSDAELAATSAADVQRLLEVWADDATLDRLMTLPFGTMPGRAAVAAYTQELTVHAWDLAVATGRPGLLDDDLAEFAERLARGFVSAQVRGGPVPFGPVVEVPPEGGPYARLAGWLGRDPGWRPDDVR